MKDIAVANIRNFAILGHSGSGKTTLTDAIAFKLGLNDRFGSVPNGTSVSDFTDEEKTRKISIFAANFEGVYTNPTGTFCLVFTDCPGFADFHGQVVGAVRAVGNVLIAVDATAGVQVGTRRAWEACEAVGLMARSFVITGIDKENANFDKTVASIQDAFGTHCIPVVVPAGKTRVTDILATQELPDALKTIKTALIEEAAETDETLLEKYLEGQDLCPEEVANGLDHAIISGGFHPIFALSALTDVGVKELLDGICRLLPSPVARGFSDSDGRTIDPDPNGPFTGLVWRTVIDPFLGHLSYVRIVSGTLTPRMELLNASTGAKESVGALITIVGKKQIPLEKAGPGEIVALTKLKATKTGHTLCAPTIKCVFPPILFPSPVYHMAIHAKTQADEDKLGTAVHRLCEQDPTLFVEKNAETKQMLVKGLGDVHIDVAVSLMKSQSNVTVELSMPKVPYRETVTGTGEGHYKHKKQSGGRGQYGEVYLRVSPKRPDEEEWFIDDIVGGTIPGNFLPAIQKGLVDAMLSGVLAHCTVVNVKVSVYDGSYHDVDSSEVAFKIAGSRAFRDAMSKARPVLLEPIMTLTITIPEIFLGTINGDLTHKRGRVLGIDSIKGMHVITAEAPLAEIFKYAAELRSITGGQGSFEMAFARYDVVPSNITQKVIAEAAKHATAETDE